MLTKVREFLLRYGPLVAAFLVGLESIPHVAEYVKGILVYFNLFGVQPDPGASTAVSEVAAEVALLIGSVRKLLKLIPAFFTKYL